MLKRGKTKASAKPKGTTGPGRFPVSSDECELLLALERTGSTDAAAKLLAKHPSVISRQLGSLSARVPVVEKPDGRWRLTKAGARMAEWAREQVAAQARILSAPVHVRVATTREFGARIVAPALGELRELLGVSCVEVVVMEAGVEREVLSGRADVGLTCGRASDPAVAFRGLVDEAYALVAPAAWPRRLLAAILDEPHAAYTRAPAAKLLDLDRELSNVVALFNDIGAVREACLAGHAWAVLPRYAVAREIAQGALNVVDDVSIKPDRFGAFWLRARTESLPWLPALFEWLSERPL